MRGYYSVTLRLRVNSILIPDPLNSDTECSRYYHHDLAGMETEDLLNELHAIQSRLWFLKSDRFARMVGLFEQGRRLEWLRDRISRIGTELKKRRYVTQQLRSQPKPKPALSHGVKL